MNDTTSPVSGDTIVGSDGVTITCTVTRAGLTLWRDPQGELHNADGPALSCIDGEQMWCRHGRQHRDGDLPAHIDRFGVKEYRIDGVLHRAGGLPAIEGPEKGPWSGRQFWVNGVRHREGDLPAVERAGNVEYWRSGVRHRDGGQPAVQRADGHVEYWVDGVLHRGDGPAVVKEGVGGAEFWLNGVRYPDASAYRDAGGVPPVAPVVRAVEPEPKPNRISRRKAS